LNTFVAELFFETYQELVVAGKIEKVRLSEELPSVYCVFV